MKRLTKAELIEKLQKEHETLHHFKQLEYRRPVSLKTIEELEEVGEWKAKIEEIKFRNMHIGF